MRDHWVRLMTTARKKSPGHAVPMDLRHMILGSPCLEFRLDHKCWRDASVASWFLVDCSAQSSSESPSSVGLLGAGGLVSGSSASLGSRDSRASLPGSPLRSLREVGLRASVSV